MCEVRFIIDFSSAIFLRGFSVPVLGQCWIYSFVIPGQSLDWALVMLEGDMHIQHAGCEFG